MVKQNFLNSELKNFNSHIQKKTIANCTEQVRSRAFQSKVIYGIFFTENSQLLF